MRRTALEGTLGAFDDLRHEDTAQEMCGAEPEASLVRVAPLGT
jgi:hypothetical protein